MRQSIVGPIRMLGRAASAAGSAAPAAAGAGARSVASASADANGAITPGPATVTLPNGKAIELADGDIRFDWPAEWAPHAGTWLAWPKRGDVWRGGRAPARAAFAAVIAAIAEFEPVTVIADPSMWDEARAALPAHVRVVEMAHDDSWLRDTGPTVVRATLSNCPQPTVTTPVAVDWGFNGWGDLYGTYDKDALVARKVAEAERLPYVTVPMVLEGGSIHTDGEGTLLTTEECLLHPNRNPSLSKAEIEEQLKRFTGAAKVIWLPKGLAFDTDTNGHVDNFACFAAPGKVLLAWSDDAGDPQHAISAEALAILEAATDAKGRRLEVVKLPCPPPLFRTREEWESLDEEGRANRRAGERLAASYANFYVCNGGVVAPSFGLPGPDAAAKAVLEAAFPGRRVVQVPSREILLGGGNIHCITQQQPAL